MNTNTAISIYFLSFERNIERTTQTHTQDASKLIVLKSNGMAGGRKRDADSIETLPVPIDVRVNKNECASCLFGSVGVRFSVSFFCFWKASISLRLSSLSVVSFLSDNFLRRIGNCVQAKCAQLLRVLLCM